jgi:hypothetical protein
VNTRQLLNLCVALSVVVYSLSSQSLAKGTGQKVSPQGLRLKRAAAAQVLNKAPQTPASHVGMEARLEALEKMLKGNNGDLDLITEFIAQIKAENPSRPFVGKLEKVENELEEMAAKFHALEEAKRRGVNIDTDINIVIGQPVPGQHQLAPHIPTIGLFGSVFKNAINAVKSIGLPLFNLYLVHRIGSMLSAHQGVMESMAAQMQKLLEQAPEVLNTLDPASLMPDLGGSMPMIDVAKSVAYVLVAFLTWKTVIHKKNDSSVSNLNDVLPRAQESRHYQGCADSCLLRAW